MPKNVDEILAAESEEVVRRLIAVRLALVEHFVQKRAESTPRMRDEMRLVEIFLKGIRLRDKGTEITAEVLLSDGGAR